MADRSYRRSHRWEGPHGHRIFLDTTVRYPKTPCVRFCRFIGKQMEKVISEHASELATSHRLELYPTSDFYGFEMRRIEAHTRFMFAQVRCMHYYFQQVEECRRTRNWGACEDEGCYICQKLMPANMDPDWFFMTMALRTWLGGCKHSTNLEPWRRR